MKFHATHPEIVELSEDRTKATKDSYIKNGSVFSERVIQPGEMIFFRIYKTTNNEFRKAAVGFTPKNPDSLKNSANLMTLPEVGLGRYLSINTSLCQPNQKSRNVHMVHFTADGSVYYGIDGKLDCTQEIGAPEGQLWLFFLIGSLSEIEFIENSIPQKVMDAYKRTISKEKTINVSIMMMASGIGGMSIVADINEPLTFHNTKNQMAITQGGKAIEPLDLRTNVAFSNKPIASHECVSFAPETKGSVQLGLTSRDPSKYTSNDLNKHFTEDNFGPSDCVFLSHLQFAGGDAVHIAMVKHEKHLSAIVGLNGAHKNSKTLDGHKYWLVVRLITQTRFSILDQFVAESTQVIDNTKDNIHSPVIIEKPIPIHKPAIVEVSPKKHLPTKAAGQAVPTAKKRVQIMTPSEEPKAEKPTQKEAPHGNPYKPVPINVPVKVEKVEVKKVQQIEVPNLIDLKSASTSDEDNAERKHHYEPVAQSIYDKIYNNELTILRTLGSGAQGDVKLVSTPLLGRMAAKFFNRSDVTGMSKYEQRELAILARLNTHRFIISIHGFIFENEHNPQPMGFLMELMENGSLHSAIHDLHNVDGKPQFKVVFEKHHIYNWVQQAASAFNFMHGAGIIHRDIKPLNLLLCNDYEQLRVCDLGLSGEMRVDMTMRIGTYIYMAPEVLALATNQKETERNYNVKCDVYSLAITMWEMVHRRQPYYKETQPPILVMKKICTQGYRPVIKAELGSSDLFEMIKKSWAPSPADRPDMVEICKFAHNKLIELEKRKAIDLRIRI